MWALVVSGCGPNAEEPRIPPDVPEMGCEVTLVASDDNSASTTVEKGNTVDG